MGLEDNITSVILDWRQRPAGHSSRSVSFPVCVLRPSHYFTKRVLASEERCVRLYSDFTRTPPSKNKNINYIFIYLRDHRCWYSGSICNSRKNNCLAKMELRKSEYMRIQKSTMWTKISILHVWRFLWSSDNLEAWNWQSPCTFFCVSVV